LHVSAVTAKEASIKVCVGHRKDIVGNEDIPLKSQTAKTRSVGIEVNVLTTPGKVPENLVVGKTAEFDVALKVYVAQSGTEVEALRYLLLYHPLSSLRAHQFRYRT